MKSVKDFLEQKGYRWKPKGDLWVTNSPYRPGGDSNPSFVLYPSGVFKCYATGKSGNAITLAKYFNESLEAVNDWVPKPLPEKKPLDGYIPEQYLDITFHEKCRVTHYAQKRRIHDGYMAGVWLMRGQRWPCMIFPHVGEEFTIIGAKLRLIDGEKGDRMRTIGRVGFYILDSRIANKPTTQYLIESETSANSLWEYLRQQNLSSIVLSSGSVGSVPKKVPFNYPLKKIIDFDGDEPLWKQRIARYNHLGGENIKLKLRKGEDINSLWVQDESYKFDFLL